MLSLLRAFFRLLPPSWALGVFHRTVRHFAASMPDAFVDVPLRQCPGFTMNLKPGDVGHTELAFTGVYEPEGTKLIARIARKEGGLMVDVGANFGYYSLLWCAQNPKNTCIAFEASPIVLPHLEENIRRNRLHERVEIVKCAASRASGVVHFDTGPADQTGWGGVTNDAGQTTLKVPSVRLDDVLTGKSISLLKIDCEGADAWVLEGAASLLTRKAIHHLCFEENPPRLEKLGIPAGEAERLLRVHGYACSPLRSRPPYHDFHAWR